MVVMSCHVQYNSAYGQRSRSEGSQERTAKPCGSAPRPCRLLLSRITVFQNFVITVISTNDTETVNKSLAATMGLALIKARGQPSWS